MKISRRKSLSLSPLLVAVELLSRLHFSSLPLPFEAYYFRTSQMSYYMVQDKMGEAREKMEDWVKKGK